MRKALKITKIIIKCVVGALVLLIAAVSVYSLIRRNVYNDEMPKIFGFASATVVSGSMEPTISVGDMVIIKSQSEYEEGDIITFYDSSAGEYVTHRIITVSTDGQYVTQGDANNVADKFPVTNSAVVGKVVLTIAGAGAVISFFQSPAGLLVIIAVGVVIWLLPDLIGFIALKAGKKDENSNNEEQES